MIGMVRHIRTYRESKSVRIILVAGVVQEQVLSPEHELGQMIREDVALVALRRSENKYTGTKGSDTGNRLFNTTYLK